MRNVSTITTRGKIIFNTLRKKCARGVTSLRAIVILCIFPLPLGSAVKNNSPDWYQVQAIDYRIQVLRNKGIRHTEDQQQHTHYIQSKFSHKFLTYRK